MTFPATYNINYYYGDTFEFLVSPKDASGATFSLENYSIVRFNLSTERGAPTSSQISCYAAISEDRRSVLCAITPENALDLNPNLQYVYDVEVVSLQSPYDKVYTLLTGNVNITRDVTLPVVVEPGQVPNNPTDLISTNIGFSSITVQWTAPVEGPPVTGYKVAILPYTTDEATLQNEISTNFITLGPTQNSYTFPELQELTNYSVVVVAIGSEGDASLTTLLTNTSPITTDDNPLTIEPDFFVTNNGDTEYLINGVPNDTITLIRGEVYAFSVDDTGNPFWIQTSGLGYSAPDAYNDGVNNNGTDSGILSWVVASSAPDILYYQSQNNVDMRGIIQIVDSEES